MLSPNLTARDYPTKPIQRVIKERFEIDAAAATGWVVDKP